MNLSIFNREAGVPRFGRRIKPSELEALQPLIAQIPELKTAVIKPEFSSAVTMPASRLLKILIFPLKIIETIRDTVRTSTAITRYHQAGNQAPVVFLQWARFDEPQSKTLKLSHPFQSQPPTLTRDGHPITGCAILGKDMLNWFIHEAPASAKKA